LDGKNVGFQRIEAKSKCDTTYFGRRSISRRLSTEVRAKRPQVKRNLRSERFAVDCDFLTAPNVLATRNVCYNYCYAYVVYR